jgi:hypothetical protein
LSIQSPLHLFVLRRRFVRFCVVVVCGIVASATGARAAGLKAVQSGTATIADGAASTTATLAAVDMTTSFLVFSPRVQAANPH